MREYLKFYIDGKWVEPVEMQQVSPVNPATEEVSGTIALGSVADVDKAVQAARKAFVSWSTTSREARINDGFDFHAAFGGYKKSGNGREWGEFGFHEYLEIKSLLGYAPAQ